MIPQESINKRLAEFMNSPRPFTSYPADRVEVVARHYNLIPQNAHYSGVDQYTGHLSFVVNTETHGAPRWIKNIVDKILGR